MPGDRAADMMYHTMKTTWEAKMQDKQGRKEFQEIVRNSKMAYGQKQKVLYCQVVCYKLTSCSWLRFQAGLGLFTWMFCMLIEGP